MSGRVRADETVRVKGSNPSWLDRDREKRDGRAAEVATKVSRHRAGVLPGWAAAAEADEDVRDDDARNDDVSAATLSSAQPGRRRVAAPAVIISGARAVKPPTIVRGPRDPPAGSEDESSASEEEEDEDDIARRRAVARARLAARRAGEEEGLPVEEKKESRDADADEKPRPHPGRGASEDEGSSSWETDTDASDSDDDARVMVRPVFVSRAKRETLKNETRDGEEVADADAEWAARDEAHRRKRAEESRRLLELELERETAIANAEANAEASDVDTDDELEDPSVAYQAWRLRELARIEEDEKTRDRMFAEREEQEKIRRMSEAEKKKYFDAHPELRRGLGDETKAGGATSQGEKPKLGFMQKYYHKGAFFQDARDDEFATTEKAEIFNRDFNEATNAEKGVDRTTVPEAMRLRQGQFGKAGRSKWTHLSNEDTTFVNTEDARLRNAQQALMKQKKLEEQQPGADGGVEENKSGGNFRAGVVLGSRLAADKNVEKILDAKRAGMKSSKTTN